MAGCRLQTADCRLLIAHCRLLIAHSRLQTANCRLQTGPRAQVPGRAPVEGIAATVAVAVAVAGLALVLVLALALGVAILALVAMVTDVTHGALVFVRCLIAIGCFVLRCSALVGSCAAVRSCGMGGVGKRKARRPWTIP